jgi:hypothetical protein
LQLQDEVTKVALKFGQHVLWMDMLAYRSLADSLERIHIQEQKDFLHLSRLAQHGDEDAMKDQDWEFKQDLEALDTKVETRGNAAAFLKRFGGGI